MKLHLNFMVVALFVASMAMAQPPQGGQGGQRGQGGQGGQRGQFNREEMQKRQTDELVKELKLDAKQTEKVTAINKKYSEKMMTMFQGGQGGQGGPGAGNREGMREKMETMNKEKEAELKGVFTADQYKKYQENEKKRSEQMRQRMGNGQGPQGGGAPGGQAGQRPRRTGDE